MGYDLRTQRGYDFYLVSSSLQKAIRRGDVRCAGYFALELFPKYSEYCWKRLLTVSAEDCYGPITKEIMALYEGFKIVNKGKRGDQLGGRIFISKAVILLCTQPHSRDENIPIPDYAYDVHTRQGKMKGKTKADFFIEEDQSLAYRQLSLFDDINIGVM